MTIQSYASSDRAYVLPAGDESGKNDGNASSQQVTNFTRGTSKFRSQKSVTVYFWLSWTVHKNELQWSILFTGFIDACNVIL